MNILDVMGLILVCAISAPLVGIGICMVIVTWRSR